MIMKPIVLLLPLLISLGLSPELTEAYSFELTVDALSNKAERFDLLITGEKHGADGVKSSFRLAKKRLKTPYRLNLGSEEFRIRVESEKSERVVSKVQGIQAGKRKGSASNDGRVSLLQAGPDGWYRASAED
jgi:hypothetical protein